MTVSALAPPARFRAMGTDVEVLAVGADDAAMAVLGELAADALEVREARWSRFRPTSELCQLNDAAGAPVMVSPSTFSLIARALDAWRDTGGRYDPTVLAALEVAGYDRDFDAIDRALDGAGDGPSGSPSAVPGCADVELDSLVSAVGSRRASPSTRRHRQGRGGRRGVGRAARRRRSGRDGRARQPGRRPVRPWRRAAGIRLGRRRRRSARDRPHRAARAEGAIATSTRLRRTWTRGERTLHHLIDPRTGEPAESGLASVTVIAGEAWRAEVLAKAAFVAGIDDGRVLVEAAGVTGLFVTDDGDVLELEGLSRFRP